MWNDVGAGAALFPTALHAHAAPVAPVRVLIVGGGCCHNYAQQRELLEKD